MPISLFKSQVIKTTNYKEEAVFESSGTSGSKTSKHFVPSLKNYRENCHLIFEYFYGKVADYCVLALLPSYLEREQSSLVIMADHFIKTSKFPQSGFFLNDHQRIFDTLCQNQEQKIPTILLGVSFALVDFIAQYQLKKNTHLIVMETGGMKGRKEELTREELHSLLTQGFGVSQIHSEYGMTELLSQAYAKRGGLFRCPPTTKVLIRKQDDPFRYADNGESGGINIIDLANVYSCAFIQTDDLGKRYADGSFEVLGRFDQADVRGCNLLLNV